MAGDAILAHKLLLKLRGRLTVSMALQHILSVEHILIGFGYLLSYV